MKKPYDQKKLKEKVKNEWVNKFFDEYKPIDRQACDEGIDFIYGLAGLEPPRKIYVSSPIAAQYAANLLVEFYNAASVKT
jgi:hypothetical protein